MGKLESALVERLWLGLAQHPIPGKAFKAADEVALISETTLVSIDELVVILGFSNGDTIQQDAPIVASKKFAVSR